MPYSINYMGYEYNIINVCMSTASPPLGDYVQVARLCVVSRRNIINKKFLYDLLVEVE